MPTTIVALIIIIFAVLPGVPARSLYKTFIGTNRRETEWEKIISVISFSLIGLIVYTIIESIFHLPYPIYVMPSTFEPNSFGSSSLLPIAESLIGHFISSIIVAIFTIFVLRLASKWSSVTPYPTTWDDFVRIDVPNHWVVVRLTNGDTYAGYLEFVEKSNDQDERDIVLAEPAKFIEEEKIYKAIQYQQLFLPASIICSIAVVYDPDIDKRVTQVGSTLFLEEKNNESRSQANH